MQKRKIKKAAKKMLHLIISIFEVYFYSFSIIYALDVEVSRLNLLLVIMISVLMCAFSSHLYRDIISKKRLLIELEILELENADFNYLSRKISDEISLSSLFYNMIIIGFLILFTVAYFNLFST